MRSRQQIQKDLDAVTNAISTIIRGERVTQLSLGDGAFQRSYSFSQITYESLRLIKVDLEQELLVLDPTTIEFRSNTFVPLRVNKFYTKI